jgi:NAD(P)-dependent dehydrogenase (short-subunit alcohol dehydrogenase family)
MKNVILTGGSSGIGKAILEILKSEGFNVINLDIKKNNNSFYLKTDLSNLNDIKKSFIKIEKKFGKIHALINSAGVTFSGNIKNYSIKNWNKTVLVNLTAPFFLSQLVSKNMIKNRIKGSILNITSIGAELGFPDNPAYQASKGGLKNLTKALAYDLSKYGIRVNSLAPGYTETAMNKKSFLNKTLRKKRAERSMLRRWGKPKEIAETAFFLISEKSSFTTGQNFVVDGGWTVKGF